MSLNDHWVAMSETQPWKFFALQRLNFQSLKLNFQFLEGNFKMSEPWVIATDFINGRLREGDPTIASPTKKPLMQTTVVKSHRTYLSLFLWLHIDCFVKN